MNVFHLFLAEMAKLAVKKGVLISVIGALLVPVVYGGILLSPKWDPYDNLSNLPVAVVNKDKGATSDGEPINVGKDLVADLKKGKDLGWDFVDASEAKKGLDSLKYYMVIEIPDDFSERVTTVTEKDPKKPELNYIQNQGLNFLAAKVTSSATEKIREKLGDKITEKYTSNMFASLGDVSEGFQSAADGSAQLNDGMTELHDGTNQLLQSLTEKSGDISKLANGAKELDAGTGQMLSSLSGKQGDISKLANGSRDLSAGTQTLLNSLLGKQGDITKLANGAKDLNAGTQNLLGSLLGKQSDISLLAKGSSDLNNGTQDLLSSLTGKQGDISKLAQGSNDLNAGTQDLLNSLQAKSGDISKLADGANLANDGTGQLLKGLKDNQPGVKQLADGAKELQSRIPELKAGTSAVLTGLKGAQAAIQGKITPGTQAISDGVNTVVTESQSLGAGLTGLSADLQAYLSKHPELQNDTEFMKIYLTGKGLASAATDPEKGKKLMDLKNGASELAAAFTKHDVPNPNSLADGVNQMVEGQTSIDNGVKTLSEKVPALQQGTASIEDGWNTMVDKVGDLKAGTELIAAGNQSVNKGWGDLTDGATRLNDGASQISAGNAAVEKGWGDLTNGATRLNAGASQISAGNQAVNKGWGDLTVGATRLNDGAGQISAGNQSVNKGWGDLTVGAAKLNDGAGQISAGNSTVEKGWRDLTSGAAKIHSGTSQLSDGNLAVEKGWGDLTDGVTKLNDGAGKLNDGSMKLSTGLKDGAEQTSGINDDDKNINMFSSPVELKSDVVNKYPHYRDSTAPYVLSLALFAGILIMSLFINFKKPEDISALSWFGAKFMNLAALAIAQALLLCAVVMLILKVSVQNPGGFVLFAIFVSLVFTGIVMFFASLGNVGRFIAFALVVLQLSITGGNLPIEMLPADLRNLSQFLPFTYSIEGFKSLISLNDFGTALSNMGVLLVYLVGFTLLSFAVIMFTSSKSQPQKLDIAG
ncbi:YhgE/Pip domain-containing protein [Fictibacillus barbaricus]|uniref:Membrane protein n=1 Tax=Fictibacillus barbaricus TaxID=182136 RepID=A0ABU1U5F4_9BACL|nr:YhgE/Pip domain-containing protein [Fictibacillus barbaricus]MDR7074719.1 putative membrane protein [Fictibacillus barbaricus]